ncbi:glutamate/aspartate transport system substrate-binding protein [Cupriavidus metallidurans]|jgi:glutamate/aspartate transport system substrate-binding protein|uniref:Glutamate and aspartate transporter subunit periplasmic-binding component of ABC superfamily n=1 Tax=Cupriavidus metallidurans (strain ATCC 43123 / DSM 2839 / NBRC 102507 / CH34) TaxID=266264 RepID=Q1LQI9_CUPMC|nr:glutamate/aspartate ABC transporter substrate-binding protein [Cupriavidus metallidurans]ABF07587.1 glutamate and aspartate transporter subunit; periplasmic-binding component of ABC superfamily [Cupriavidus metallidurans CH34]AVA32836.1 amino acid ABC transporter substrate-binding protein [Cupriavidus metallidurans]MDE4917009.1 glutamate/aspartate ABC transporter substrate-binding protein [Cupriavidus metallidurans]QGS28102.1 glutamate/aspartate ABC transporter substrate-binding protein [Cup
MKSLSVRPTPVTRLLAAAALLCAAAGAHAADGDTLKKIKDSGVISLGYRESSIPFSYSDGKEVMGYSHDYLLAIVDKVKSTLNMPNLQVKLTPITSQNRIPLMQNGTIDIECGSTTNNLERQKQVAFSNSLFIYGIRMLTKKDSGVTDFPQLKDKNVVTTAGTTGERLLVKMNGEGMNMNLTSAKDHGQAFLILESGRAAAFVMDEPLLYGERTKAKNAAEWVVAGKPLQTENYACMFRKDDPSFKKLVDGVVADIMTSGRGEKLYAKWFQSPIPPRNINMNYPLSPDMKQLFAEPNDKAFQ